MATKVMMEALSPTMEEGRLVKWVKNEGDAVKQGDVLAEVETDKAVMELVARGEGVLRKRLVPEGTSTPVGQLIGVIGTADENIDAMVAGAGGGAAGGGEAPKVDGQAAPAAPAQGQEARNRAGAAAEIGTAQAIAVEKAASGAPVTAPTTSAAGGAPPAGGPPRTAMPKQDDHASEQAGHAGENGGRLRSSPLARRMASEQGVSLEGVRGSGPGGRIIKRDVEQAMAAGPAQRPAAAGAAAAPRGAAQGADYEDVALTQIRKTIARRLSESIGPIPTFYLTQELDLGKVSELRSALTQFGDEFKVSFNDVILKAVATALAQHPEVNAHWLGDRIRYHNRVHLGMAVATDDGLIVPVIFDADQKRMSEISAEAKQLARAARERKLKPEQYTGSTFSVSNLGMFGIDQFTAIINPPEAGILAIGAVEDKAVVVDGKVEVRKRLRLTMSCDHRVIDGAVGAKFLQTLRRMLENPLMLVY
jgi:pyruvate dehydrogenase E2 component (dihydrolipoamide acetyltransferase)